MENEVKDDAEIAALVRAFEACEIHPAEFKHYQHLTVALWFVAHFPFPQASKLMRAGIQKLAAAYNKMGYHETITLFWLTIVRSFLESAMKDESIAAVANRLISDCGNKNLIYEYYSREKLNSSHARNEWVEPDLKPLRSNLRSSTRRRAFRPASAAWLSKS